MAYQSLYRRYRPRTFAEVRGQEHLVAALRNAVREERVGHAYLLSGPRGTGKTSTARILAKVLNCEEPVDGEPCGECESCRAIDAGTSFDVVELDAASNNKVDDVRDLISRAALGTPGRTKVYILDEVHMLTAQASNALLKTLEEPPPHVVFVLATTDPQKVLDTIKSRTQHFEVHLLAAKELESLVRDVVADAGLDVPDEAVEYVVRVGAGSARDTLSALESVSAAGRIDDDGRPLDELVEALCDRDTGRALLAIDAAVATDRAPRQLGEALMGRLRDVFLASLGAPLDRLPDADRERVTDQAARLTAAGATRALETIGEAFVGIQDAPDPRITLEVALVRLTRPDADLSIAALADRITRLEHGLGPSGATSAATTSPKTPAPTPPIAPDTSAAPTSSAPRDEQRPAEASPAAPGAAASGGRPADGARQALAAKKASSSSGGSRGASPPRPQPSSESPPPAPASTPAVTASVPTSAPPTTQPSAGAAELPTRDEITLAWGDTVLASLGRAKARYAGGRWLDVADGVAVYGLPNKIHAAKCEEVRADVEATLERHFGRTVPIRIVVAPGAPAPAVPGGPPSPTDGADAPDDEAIDLDELTDASSSVSSGLDRVAEVFPGAELVEGE